MEHGLNLGSKAALLAILPLLSTLSTLGLSGCTESGRLRPNIIVIVADDLGWADVGYHGSPIKTPNIDRLAAEGIRFEHFYAQPWCSATRASFLTGRFPPAFAWDVPPANLQRGGSGMDPEEYTLPERFQLRLVPQREHAGAECGSQRRQTAMTR